MTEQERFTEYLTAYLKGRRYISQQQANTFYNEWASHRAETAEKDTAYYRLYREYDTEVNLINTILKDIEEDNLDTCAELSLYI